MNKPRKPRVSDDALQNIADQVRSGELTPSHAIDLIHSLYDGEDRTAARIIDYCFDIEEWLSCR